MKSLEFSQLGLVGHWKFNEGIGATAKDSSPEGNHGTITDGVWTNDAERRGVLTLNGSSGFVDCGNDASLSIITEMTIEAIIKTSYTGDEQTIVCRVKTSDPYNGYLLNIGGQTNDHKLNVWTGINNGMVNGNTSINDGILHHVATTVIGDAAILYVDGTVDGDGTVDTLSSLSQDLWIGKEHITSRWFKGIIDEIRIYNRALPAAEILAHYSLKKHLMDVQNGC